MTTCNIFAHLSVAVVGWLMLFFITCLFVIQILQSSHLSFILLCCFVCSVCWTIAYSAAVVIFILITVLLTFVYYSMSVVLFVCVIIFNHHRCLVLFLNLIIFGFTCAVATVQDHAQDRWY